MAEQSIWHGAPTDDDYGGSFCTICVFCTEACAVLKRRRLQELIGAVARTQL